MRTLAELSNYRVTKVENDTTSLEMGFVAMPAGLERWVWLEHWALWESEVLERLPVALQGFVEPSSRQPVALRGFVEPSSLQPVLGSVGLSFGLRTSWPILDFANVEKTPVQLLGEVLLRWAYPIV